jgi:putative glycosyltransferase (TIGR04372 family)
MFFLSQTISYFFYFIGYLIITPKNSSFGGFYLSIINGFRLAKHKNKKSILVIPLINLYEKNFLNIYHSDLLIRIFKKYSLFEKILCLILTVYINFNILILFLLKQIFAKKYNSKYIHLIFSAYIGYADKNNKYDFFLKKLKINLDVLGNFKIDLSYLYKKNIYKTVSFCIKDNNYQKIKEISIFLSSDINSCRKPLDYIIHENLKVIRVGENLMNKFNYISKDYNDTCFQKNHNALFNKTIANSEFYFGSGSSMGLASEIFSKKKFVINEQDHRELCYSRSLNNFIILKKLYCSKTKKILKISELFEKKIFSFRDIVKELKDKVIYSEDNTEVEIFDGLVEFYEFNFKNKKSDFPLNKNYLEMRSEYINKFYFNTDQAQYKNFTCRIPESYLSKYLF